MPPAIQQNKIEFRCNKEIRAAADDKGNVVIEGHAAVFERESEILGYWPRPWREIIAKGAFTKVLAANPDVRALTSHDTSIQCVIGRTVAGTLELREDNIGLAVRIVLPKTQIASDLAEQIRVGNVDSMSFAFIVNQESIQIINRGDYDVQVVNEVDSLIEVSVVTFPAYKQTDIGEGRAVASVANFRSAPEFRKRFETLEPKTNLELSRRKLELAKQKYLL